MSRRRISKASPRSNVRSISWRFGGGVFLLLVAVLGLWQAGRASLAYRLIHEASFGESRHDPEKALLLHHRGYRHYPHYYHQAIRAATLAWYEYQRAKEEGDTEQAEQFLNTVRVWTRIGLYRNPYPLQLRWLNQRLLEIDDSIEAAIEYWERHTDWHFWYAYNHVVLADLYIRAGRFDDAEQTLRMLRGSPHYSQTASALRRAREAATRPDSEEPAPE